MFDQFFTTYESVDVPYVKPKGYDEVKQRYEQFMREETDSLLQSKYSYEIPEFKGMTITFDNKEEEKKEEDSLFINYVNTPISKDVKLDDHIRTNGNIVITALMNGLGLTRAQASGIAGVLAAESNLLPTSFNKAEKRGTLIRSGANNKRTPYGTKNSPWSYGAGIAQWTFTDRKEKALMGGLGISKDEAKKIIQSTGIEGLSIEDQIKMVIYELQSDYKATLEGIKKCKTPEEAAATYYCHSVAGYSTSTNPATQKEIDTMNKKYNYVGANNQINKGINFAIKFSK